MNKYLLLFCFLFFQPLYESYGNTTKVLSTKDDYVYIFLLNIDECPPCLLNAYNVALSLIERKVPKQKIIFLIEDRRKILKSNYVENLNHIFDSNKITILWNDKLYSQLKIGNKAYEKGSTLLIFDNNKSVFIFNKSAKNISVEDIVSYVNN